MTDTVEAIVAEMRERVRLVDRMTVSEYADRLQSAHDAEARDARRYRKLVSPDMPSAPKGGAHVIVDGQYGLEVCESKEQLDAAIDRAMEGEDG